MLNQSFLLPPSQGIWWWQLSSWSVSLWSERRYGSLCRCPAALGAEGTDGCCRLTLVPPAHVTGVTVHTSCNSCLHLCHWSFHQSWGRTGECVSFFVQTVRILQVNILLLQMIRVVDVRKTPTIYYPTVCIGFYMVPVYGCNTKLMVARYMWPCFWSGIYMSMALPS